MFGIIDMEDDEDYSDIVRDLGFRPSMDETDDEEQPRFLDRFQDRLVRS